MVPPAAAPAPNGSKVGVALANKSEVSPVQNGTTAKEGSSNAEVKSEAPAALNGNKPLFEFKFDGPLKIRTSGEKGGMHEISLLQYDKMDRKERIKTGYSLDLKKHNGHSVGSSINSSSSKSVLPFHTPREAVVSAVTAVCERCGVEEIQMASCRQCQKVFYCSASCKRADVKEHATVCRAFITLRRYGEERAEFAARLREPEDGCATCGFWRDSLESCKLCGEVAFCCSRCGEKGAEKHRAVCDAFKLIRAYKKKQSTLRHLHVE